MKNNNLLIFLGIGGALVGYYFWNKNRQKQLTQQAQPVAEEEDAKGEVVPVGSGGGGGFSAPTTPVTTPTPTVVIATNPTPTSGSVAVTQPLSLTTPPLLTALQNAVSSPAPAPTSAPAPKPTMTSPAPAPIISKPSISLAKPVTMTTPKSPFSGMDGRNAYDLDLVNDL